MKFWQFLNVRMAIFAKWPKILATFSPDFWSFWCLHFLVEFEVDRMRSKESTKNGRKGADGLNCIIFVNFWAIFEIYNKNYLAKKLCLSDNFEIFVIQPVRSLIIQLISYRLLVRCLSFWKLSLCLHLYVKCLFDY